jgi:uncharacterized glyoxalase superfamily protein PhnB
MNGTNASHSCKPPPGAGPTVRFMSIHPTLRYDDPHAAITFLTGALGLVEQNVYTAEDGSVAHAELSFGDGVVMLGTRAGGDRRFDTGRAVIYLVADGAGAVDAHHDRAVAAGAEVVLELTDQPYGSREFAVLDPEGNVWTVGSYRPVIKSAARG